MEHISTSTNLVNIQTTTTKSIKQSSSYIYRDLFIWIFFILFVPLVFFSIYYFAKASHSQTHIEPPTFTEYNKQIAPSIDDTNYLGLEFTDPHLTRNKFIKSTSKVSNSPRRPLMKKTLAKYGVLCNDGSTATYYLRLSETNSKDWLILVDGGFFCYDALTCHQRFVNSNNLTSSKDYKSFRYASGILSSSENENKYWSDVNVVNIPYCSSDLWIGDTNKQTGLECKGNCTDFHFMGHRILDSVFTDLLNGYRMKESKLIVLAGVSSGGIGTLLNANRLKEKLDSTAPNAKLKIIIDSSWLLDLPYSYLCDYLDDTNSHACIVNQIFMNAIQFWNAKLPDECLSLKNLWSCLLPYKLIPKLKMPVYIIQSLFDETQLLEKFRAVSNHQTDFFKKTLQTTSLKTHQTIASEIREPNGFFVPSCTTHMLLTRDDFSKIRIGSLYLEDAVYMWANDLKSNGDDNSIEECEWPDCHATCPGILHPENGRYIVSPLEYFSYFGVVNYKSMARKLKIRVKRLKLFENYNHTMSLLMKD